MRVRADIDAEMRYYDGSNLLDEDKVSVANTTTVRVEWQSGHLPVSATCMTSEVTRGMHWVPLEIGVSNEVTNEYPACAE